MPRIVGWLAHPFIPPNEDIEDELDVLAFLRLLLLVVFMCFISITNCVLFCFSFENVTGDDGREDEAIRVPPGILARELGSSPGQGILAVGVEEIGHLLVAIRRR